MPVEGNSDITEIPKQGKTESPGPLTARFSPLTVVTFETQCPAFRLVSMARKGAVCVSPNGIVLHALYRRGNSFSVTELQSGTSFHSRTRGGCVLFEGRAFPVTLSSSPVLC